MQARKSDLGSGFNSDRAERPGIVQGGSPAHSLEQNRLSNAGLAPDHNRSPALAQTVDQHVQDCALLLALDQFGTRVDQGQPAHRASMGAAQCSVHFEGAAPRFRVNTSTYL